MTFSAAWGSRHLATHPAVAEAVGEQAETLLHVSNLYGTEPGPEVAATLDRLLGGGGQVFFCNSGAEANEAAIKLARLVGGRGRHVVISAYGSFHGRTLATLHATGQPEKHEPFAPMPEGFRHVAFGDSEALEAAVDPSVTAVLLEVIQGEGGVNPAPDDYLEAVRRLCDERGALLIIDEVQTGLGRTGRWFAHQHTDVRPDIVTVAKALGNGVPIGALGTGGGGRRLLTRRSRHHSSGASRSLPPRLGRFSPPWRRRTFPQQLRLEARADGRAPVHRLCRRRPGLGTPAGGRAQRRGWAGGASRALGRGLVVNGVTASSSVSPRPSPFPRPTTRASTAREGAREGTRCARPVWPENAQPGLV